MKVITLRNIPPEVARLIIPLPDIWIAASAMQFGLLLVTTDAHYEHISQIAVELHAVGDQCPTGADRNSRINAVSSSA